MATKFRVYDGEQIVFYSTDLTKSATLFLNSSDELEVGILAGHTDAANAGIKTTNLNATGNVSGTWTGGIISAVKGGTGIGTYVVGDILYADTTTTLARLAKGANGQFLTMAAGALSWSNTIATGGLNITGDLTVTGNMTVNGTTTTVNTTTLAVSDNIITLNQDVTGVPSENAGVEVERGTSTNSMLNWNETTDAWEIDKAGAAGTLEQIVTLTSSQLLTNKTYSSSATATGLTLTPLATGFSVAGGTTSKTLTATATLTLTGTDNSQLSLAGNLTTAGAYALTLTQTGATNVTLPTSGTLYGTATGSITSAQLAASLTNETGSGFAVFATSPTLTTPILGVATGTSLALGGATIGTNALAVTGTSLFTGDMTIAGHVLPNATDTYDLGSSTKLWRKGWLSEMEAVLFAKETITLLGGWFYVTQNAGVFPTDVNNSQTTIDFGQAMTPNQFVVLRAVGTVEYIQVLTLVSGTTYNVTRNLDGSGINSWVAGSPYAVLGVSGDGRIEMKAGTNPYISIFKQGATYNAQVETTRMSDLGFFGYDTSANTIFSIQTNGTAQIAGWNFSTTTLSNGNISLSTGALTATDQKIYISAANTAITVGAKIYLNGATTNASYIGVGATSWEADGVWFGQTAAAVYKFSIGAGATAQRMTWDDANLTIYNAANGTIFQAGGTNVTLAGWYVNTASLWSGNSVAGSGNIILTQSSTAANAKIALGTSADAITVGNANVGSVIYGDGTFKFQSGAADYVKGNGTTLNIASTSFSFAGSTTILIDTTKIALGASASTLSLTVGTGVYANTTGHFKAGSTTAYIKWDGTNFTWAGANNSLSATTFTTTNASIGGWGIDATTISSSGGINLVHSATAASNYIGIGTGGYGNASQSFWADGSGRMSLKDKFLWTGAALTVNGTIQATAGYFGNTANVIDSEGLKISDGTYTRTYITNLSSWRTPTLGSDLITNGTFEAGNITGWDATAGAIISGAGDGNSSTFALSLPATGNVTYQEIVSTSAGTYYELNFDARQKSYYGYVTVTIYKWNGTDYTTIAPQVSSIGLSSLYASYNIPFYNVNANKVKIQFTAVAATETYPVQLDNITFKEHRFFSELNSQGLYIYVTPSNYIKMGRDAIDIRTSSMTVNSMVVSSNLTVNGSLTVNGNQTIIGSTTVAAPIQILNSGALLSSGYSGIEIDNAVAVTGTGPVFLYDVSASRWKFGVRASGNNGAQTAFTFDTGNLGTVITDISTDTLTNKRLTSPKLNEDVAVTTTATKLNYITSATGTTGTASTNIVFSTSPTLVTPNLGTPSTLVVTNASGTASININGTVGATTANTGVFTTATVNTGLVPDANDGAYLGTTALGFSDLFLATGGVINWANGEVTLTGGGNLLTLAGGDLALGANNLTLTGSIAATGSRVTKGWFTDLESTNALTIGGVKISDTIRIEEALSTGGLAQDTAHQVPGGVAYNAWVGSGAGTTFQTSRTMQVFIDGRLQRPGATYDYVECNNLGTAVAQYASTTYIKFTYDLAEGTNITYIITAV